MSRSELQALAHLAPRITVATAQACDGAPAGHRRGLDCLQRTDGGRGESRFVRFAPSKRQLLKHDRDASPIAIATSVIRTLAVFV